MAMSEAVHLCLSNIPDMSHPSSSSSFQPLFNAALQEYTNQTGIKLDDHPIAKQLQNCDSVASISSLLQEQAQRFREFREDGKIMKSLNSAIHVLYTLSTSTTLGEGIGIVCQKVPYFHSFSMICVPQPFPPAKAVFAAFAILLAVRLISPF
jgi:hypothetical protein